MKGNSLIGHRAVPAHCNWPSLSHTLSGLGIHSLGYRICCGGLSVCMSSNSKLQSCSSVLAQAASCLLSWLCHAMMSWLCQQDSRWSSADHAQAHNVKLPVRPSLGMQVHITSQPMLSTCKFLLQQQADTFASLLSSHCFNQITAIWHTNTFCPAQDNMQEAEEWEQWQDGDVDISSSDDGAALSESDDSMYSEGARAPRTRAQRRARRADKRPRPSPDHRGQRARKRQKLQHTQYAEDASDEEELEEVPSCMLDCNCLTCRV